MSTNGTSRDLRSSRKRTSKACTRCNRQKIRCNGADPCQQCRKRSLECHFDGQGMDDRGITSNIQVTPVADEAGTATTTLSSFNTSHDNFLSPHRQDGTNTSPSKNSELINFTLDDISEPSLSISKDLGSVVVGSADGASFTNPLAFYTANWVKAPSGKPLFMGTSSNWSFGRRVLSMTYEQLYGIPLPPDNLLFNENVYNIGWDGQRNYITQATFDFSMLPTADFAIHLINVAKFHCGDLFYLFDEATFMKQFAAFQDNPRKHVSESVLWYVHYLLMLAFGKAFATPAVNSQWPSGISYFVQAMRVMPDLTMFETDPIEVIQVLCCKALYLQCLNRRAPAHRAIGEALRIALEHGMHTDMRSLILHEDYVERCRTLWWTVYILERQMSSLMGIPVGIAEDCISTPFPLLHGQLRRSNSLQIQVRLSQVLSETDKTVYGLEGKINSRYIKATQSALRKLANVADQLNNSFSLQSKNASCGISRLSAHLHLFQHQCISICTRPLLYTFLQSKCGQSENSIMCWLESENIRSLLRISIESSQQIVRILSFILDHGLLETFLPFDLDAVFTSTMSIVIAAAIDPTLVGDHSPWLYHAYNILGEMESRGNIIAKMINHEIQQLVHQLRQLTSNSTQSRLNFRADGYRARSNSDLNELHGESSGEFDMHWDISAEQLLQIADSLDMDNLPWLMNEMSPS